MKKQTLPISILILVAIIGVGVWFAYTKEIPNDEVVPQVIFEDTLPTLREVSDGLIAQGYSRGAGMSNPNASLSVQTYILNGNVHEKTVAVLYFITAETQREDVRQSKVYDIIEIDPASYCKSDCGDLKPLITNCGPVGSSLPLLGVTTEAQTPVYAAWDIDPTFRKIIQYKNPESLICYYNPDFEP